MEKEIWKDIEGYEGYYMVSNLGNVKSLERTVWNNSRGCYITVPERIRKGRDNGKGYLQVALWKDGKDKYYYIHQLVAQAFIPNPEGYNEVNHINEDKSDNRADNLEFCDRSYNCNYGTRNNRLAEKMRGRKFSEEHNKKIAEKLRNNPKISKPVMGINKINGLILLFPSIMEASRQLGINQQSICACCKGKRKTAGNYHWMYVQK